MNIEDDAVEQDDDIVVIEERDKHTILYIVIAAILGLAMGGLIGSIAAKSKWQSAYQVLESKIATFEQQQKDIVVEKITVVEEKQANLEEEVEQRVSNALTIKNEEFQQQQQQSKTLITELEKINIELEQLVEQQKTKLDANSKEIASLTRQTDMQSTMLERSRELFQRELNIKQQLTRLQTERESLAPKLERYKKECDLFLEGKSWDASSKSCDLHDEVNSNISQMDQMIEVHKLDLREIEQIADQLGL